MRDTTESNPAHPSAERSHLSRRSLLATTATLASSTGGLLLLPSSVQAAKTGTEPSRGAGIITASDRSGIAETTAGKVRGYSRNGIYTFKGIPYAQTTEGKGRFMPPRKPEPWTGVRSSMYYGQVCPQGSRTGWASDENAFMFEWDDGQPGEDCLRVNVWTRGPERQPQAPGHGLDPRRRLFRRLRPGTQVL